MHTSKLILFISLFLLCCEASSQIDASVLEVGKQIDANISLGEKHSFFIELAEGEYALIHLEQKGIDLKASTKNSEDEFIEEFDSPHGNNGDEMILIDSKKEDRYLVEVEPFAEDKRVKSGAYSIQLISVEKEVSQHVNQILHSIEKRGHIPGFAVAIVNTQEKLYQSSGGYSNLQDSIAFSNNTLQSIASISKTFIGLSLMHLVDEGKISLDSPINDILPFNVSNPYFPETSITVKHLATHTSSINDQNFYHHAYLFKDTLPKNKGDYSRRQLREYKRAQSNDNSGLEVFLKEHLSEGGSEFAKKNFLKQKPGENWYYSNVGAALAAYIVEKCSGMSYDKYVMEIILKKLEIEECYWSKDLPDKTTNAIKYSIDFVRLPQTNVITYPDSDLYMTCSSLSDYLIKLMAQYFQESNSPNSFDLRTMMSPHHTQSHGKFQGRQDGIFWEFSKSGVMGHSGGDAGVSAMMYFNPKNEFGYVYLCNIMPLGSDHTAVASRLIWNTLKRYASSFDRTEND